jgi:hypothetical protein
MQVRAGREKAPRRGHSEISGLPLVSAMALAYITSFESRVSDVLRASL